MATLAVRGSASPFSYPRATVPLFLLAIPLYVPLVAFLVWGYEQYSFAVVGTFFIPVLALQRVAHLYQEQRAAARGLSDAYQRLEQAHLSFAAALIATLDARDRYTAGHSAAVAIYSRDIAARMDLSPDLQQRIHLAGLVHDIGKIGLPPGLLEKEGPLTLEERRVMQTHSEIGAGILEKVEDYGDVAAIVRHHHERMDGNGYPNGVSGEEIPLLSRIIAVADAYNAMTSDRPYARPCQAVWPACDWHRPLARSSTRQSSLHSKQSSRLRTRITDSANGPTLTSPPVAMATGKCRRQPPLQPLDLRDPNCSG